MIWVATALVGGVGAVVRFVVTTRVNERYGAPRGTVCVNLVGTAALVLLLMMDSSADLRHVVGIGLLGGLTTFSTWMVDGLRLALDQDVGAALRHLAKVSMMAVLIASIVLVVPA